jgi:hypothetical protein
MSVHTRQRNWMLPLLAALAMSVGWGFRGDYGHEAGAMVPGALLALAVCLASGRVDWWQRASVLALLGALGWAFGGQMSYGMVIGYTAHSTFGNVLYGYACLFLIGALWGSVGAGVLALGVTEARSTLERFTGPLVTFYFGADGVAAERCNGTLERPLALTRYRLGRGHGGLAGSGWVRGAASAGTPGLRIDCAAGAGLVAWTGRADRLVGMADDAAAQRQLGGHAGSVARLAGLSDQGPQPLGVTARGVWLHRWRHRLCGG